jgi:hypothetical protein
VSKIPQIALVLFFAFLFSGITSCKKDKFIKDADAKLEFSQDSILFDTVFTTIGSATQNFRIRNNHSKKILISSIYLEGGNSSQFKINVDGVPGVSFSDLEIAPHDSMYVFVQVNVNPTNANSPLIISDALHFVTNGNDQKMPLEAWGQDAYYHLPTDAIKFKDGSYLPFSYLNNDTNAITVNWKKDKPHVIYGYLVVYTGQKLTIDAGVRVYLNYKAGLWVYNGGELKVLGQKGDEVIFQGARREKDYADEPGQWDRIWINEGSANNVIDYAIIKNGYIGVQAELLDGKNFLGKKGLRLTNTKIQNMSLWGLYCLGFNVYAGNNVISNCQEHCLNMVVGGSYRFYHCTFSNFWSKEKSRDKPTVQFSNYTELQVIPDTVYFGNCIIDGKLTNEINMDLNRGDSIFKPVVTFSSCWLKTDMDVTGSQFRDVRKDSKTPLDYKDIGTYNFEPTAGESRIKAFTDPQAGTDAMKFPNDISGTSRTNTLSGVTAGAYNVQ